MDKQTIKHYESIEELRDLDNSALMQALKDTHDNISKAFDAWDLSSSSNSFIASNPTLIRSLLKGEMDANLKDFELIYQAICERTV